MALTNKQKQEALRKNRAAAGLKELRSVWVTSAEEATIKPEIKNRLVELRKEKE